MAAIRFFRRGITKVYWVPTVASATLVPTAAEVTAGTDMSPDIESMDGFTFENNPIATPDLSTTFEGSIPGADKASSPTLTFYEKKGSGTPNPLQTTLAKGTAGYIAIFFAGIAASAPAAADKCEVWSVISSGPTRNYDTGEVAARWSAKFGPQVAPNFSATLT